MPDASPAKWHLAHSSWFFETFVLRDHMADYRLFDDRFPFLFNSYYEAEGPRHARPQRGLLTRPSLAEILVFRRHVTEAVLENFIQLADNCGDLIMLGIQHEQQHQELLLTDLLHLFSLNPLGPAVWPGEITASDQLPRDLEWIAGATGEHVIGHQGTIFAFDCEGPAHRVILVPHSIASRTVTIGEWQAFVEDGGYRTPQFWLADGWAWVQAQGISAPAYWRDHDQEGPQHFTLSGWQPRDANAPVAHISLYEADAYASWAAAQWRGIRLPTEAEWEVAAQQLNPASGQFLDLDDVVSPHPAFYEAGLHQPGLSQMFGSLWEWTGSAYRPYPGFRAAKGAVGEYNGKFMSGQFVLRGGSCATPPGHVRASYRNFFYPHQRWQFTGLRLARDEA
jgi:ergothioneine biosynthesis protein EgtB